MDNNNFWVRCTIAQCVIVPVQTYSQYGEDGNTHQEHRLGIRFASLPFHDHAVGPDYYIQLEERQTGANHLYNTPEEALTEYESR